MKLTDYYLKSNLVSAETNSSNVSTKQDRRNYNASFEKLLNAERNSTSSSRPEPKLRDSVNDKRNPKSRETDRTPKENDYKVASENTRTTTKTSENKSEKTTVSSKTQENTTQKTATAEELVSEIADSLGIPADVIMQILASLNMSVTDLSVPENMSLFVQKLFNLSSPAELLNIPNVSEIFTKITKTLEKVTVVVNDDAPLSFEDSLMSLDSQSQKTVGAATEQTPEILPSKETANNTPIVHEKHAESPHETNEDPDAEILTSKTSSDAVLDEELKPLNPEEHIVAATKTPTQNASGDKSTSSSLVAQRNVIPVDNPQNPDFNPFAHNVVSDTQITQVADKIAASPTNTLEIVKQIVDQMKVEVKFDTTELKMTLKPESLGEVSLKISTQNGIVTAQFFAESQRVKEVIESQFNQLKGTLEEKGIQVAEITVFVGADNSETGGQTNYFSQNSHDQRNSPSVGEIASSGLDTADQEPVVDENGNILEVNIKA